MSNTLFVTAARKKLRFNMRNGVISVEDLWDLSLKSLDELAISIDKQIGAGHSRSFLENPDPKTNAAHAENVLRLEILKFVIDTKQEENKAVLASAAKRQQKNFLNELLEKKRIDNMATMSIEEIEAQLKALDA